MERDECWWTNSPAPWSPVRESWAKPTDLPRSLALLPRTQLSCHFLGPPDVTILPLISAKGSRLLQW